VRSNVRTVFLLVNAALLTDFQKIALVNDFQVR
jgi:hypothetical protein